MNKASFAVSDSSIGRPALRSLAIGLIGAISGAAEVMNLLAGETIVAIGRIGLLVYLAAGGVVGIITLAIIDRASRPFANQPSPPQQIGWLDTVSYLPALLTMIGFFGIRIPLVVIVLLTILCRAGVILAVMSADRRSMLFQSLGWLAFLFLISGFAALIYQIVWQRTLFTAFGVNIESITIIVSLFMFGLGIGSFVGGIVSHKYPDKAPLLFFCCEVGIGIFGVISLPLISVVSRATLQGSLLQVSLAVFGLLCIPTILMGATLPILVSHLCRSLRSVGKSVGLLYCINTIGSAIACFLTADFLFVLLGQQGAVLVAAACNFGVGLLVLQFARKIANRSGQGEELRPATQSSVDAIDLAATTGTLVDTPAMSHRLFVLIFAAAIGYISLSQEMVWMRIVSYMTGGRPAVFAHVLGFFLIGVAFGSFLAEKLCERFFPPGRSPARFIALMLLISGVFYYLSIAGIATLYSVMQRTGLVATHVVVVFVSFLLGGIFPVLCHYGARTGAKAGLAVSRLYLANIVGSTLGPLLTGFILMQYFSTAAIVLGLSVATLLLAGLAWLFDARGKWFLFPAGSLALSFFLIVSHGSLYDRVLEKLQCDWIGQRYKSLVENRHGIIAAINKFPGDAAYTGDILYGGGKYDGRFSTDPVINSNLIDRCYMIAKLHPKPQQVLEVGLATGSWSRVIANYQPVEHVTVVEINPGYIEMIKQYPEQATILYDPKVTIDIDDGRRWLNRHPDRKFDFILQNTTFHWRNQITNLVSEEYLRLCKAHLNNGGVMFYNTTGSNDIAYTAAKVFKHVTRYSNFIAVSDTPFVMTTDQARVNLLKFVVDGKPVLDITKSDQKTLVDRLAEWKFPDEARSILAQTNLRLISDDNMATEYKNVHWQSDEISWSNYLTALRKSWSGHAERE